jgi:magnesium transporter
MQQYLLTTQSYVLADKPSPSNAPQWLRFDATEAAQIPNFIATVQHLSGLIVQDLHVQDAGNVLHPSHYDGVLDYGRVVFRTLLPLHIRTASAATVTVPLNKKHRHRLPAITTQPLTFFIANTVLITVQHGEQIDLLACLERLKTHAHTGHTGTTHAAQGVHLTPHQLLLRFVNAQVDAYLALRQPLTDQLDRWQRELLDPRRAFNDWTALLDARLELRKLEALSEEQMDAVGELREAWLEQNAVPYDAAECDNLRVRLADIVEHIGRVLNHAKRLESSVESAIQLHFAAVAHQTNHTVRNLTILTGVFAPLSLLTGFYGMNVPLPWQQEPNAVGWIMLGMFLSAAGVLGSIFVSRWLRRRSDR